MSSPTWFFDGDKKRIYEVPPSATYATDGNGYRIYNGGSNLAILSVDVKKDLWSRWVDWVQTHDWSVPAFSVSGGSQRPTGEFSPADFSLLTASGWRIVLANYTHESIFYGNLFSEGTDSLFDFSRLTVNGVIPRLQGSANLLTYTSSVTGNEYSLEQIANAVLDALVADHVIEGSVVDVLKKTLSSAKLASILSA